MKKTIYLHAGTHKTGTTAIQKFLYGNKDELLLYNYDYLIDNCIWNAHHPIGWSFQGTQSAIIQYCPWYERGIINNLEEEINRSEKQNFILSSENLFQLKNLDFIERFFKRFSGFDFKVMIYLRHQSSFIESWYLELVRADYCKLDASLEDFVNHPMYQLDYNSELIAWTNFVEKQNIYLFDFERESSKGLIKGFCEFLDLDIGSFCAPTTKTNERISPAQLKKLLDLNGSNLTHSDWLQKREQILTSSANIEMSEQGRTLSILDEKLVKRIYMQYEQSNGLLKDNFFFSFS